MDFCRAGTLTSSSPWREAVPRRPSCSLHGPPTEVAPTCTSVNPNLAGGTDENDVVAAFRHHSRLRRAPASAACCIRKDRRQLPRKVKGSSHPPKCETAILTICSLFFILCFLLCGLQRSSMSVFVERQRSFCHDPCQRW